MNLKLRLEKLCDSRAWVKLHFGDGTSLTGRMFRLGHDYVEMESYGDSDKRASADFAKHLIPIGLIKFLTIESTAFAELERRRLDYLAHLDTSDLDLDMDNRRHDLPEFEK